MWQFNGILVTHDTLERICPNRTDRALIRLQLQNSNIFTPYFYISFYISTIHSQPIYLICKAHFNMARATALHFLVTSLARETSEHLIPKGIKLTLHLEGRASPSCEFWGMSCPPATSPAQWMALRASLQKWRAADGQSAAGIACRGDAPRAHSRSKWISCCEWCLNSRLLLLRDTAFTPVRYPMPFSAIALRTGTAARGIA